VVSSQKGDQPDAKAPESTIDAVVDLRTIARRRAGEKRQSKDCDFNVTVLSREDKGRRRSGNDDPIRASMSRRGVAIREGRPGTVRGCR
jgi:hypothetical protein